MPLSPRSVLLPFLSRRRFAVVALLYLLRSVTCFTLISATAELFIKVKITCNHSLCGHWAEVLTGYACDPFWLVSETLLEAKGEKRV